MLTTQDILALCELPPTTFQRWIDARVVVPSEPGGSGRGKVRKFTLMQSVGIVVGARVHRSAYGCHLTYLGEIVDGFSQMKESELLQEFNEGRTHFVVVQCRRPILAPPQPYWISVEEAYRDVEKAYRAVKAKLSKQAAKPKATRARAKSK